MIVLKIIVLAVVILLTMLLIIKESIPWEALFSFYVLAFVILGLTYFITSLFENLSFKKKQDINQLIPLAFLLVTQITYVVLLISFSNFNHLDSSTDFIKSNEIMLDLHGSKKQDSLINKEILKALDSLNIRSAYGIKMINQSINFSLDSTSYSIFKSIIMCQRITEPYGNCFELTFKFDENGKIVELEKQELTDDDIDKMLNNMHKYESMIEE